MHPIISPIMNGCEKLSDCLLFVLLESKTDSMTGKHGISDVMGKMQNEIQRSHSSFDYKKSRVSYFQTV